MKKTKKTLLFIAIINVAMFCCYVFYMFQGRVSTRILYFIGFTMLVALCAFIAYLHIRKGNKRIFIHARYLFLTLSVMGLVICCLWVPLIIHGIIVYVNGDLMKCINPCEITGFGDSGPLLNVLLQSVPFYTGELGVLLATIYSFKLKKQPSNGL